MMRLIRYFYLFSILYSTGCFEILKDGGVREEGLDNYNYVGGVWHYISYVILILPLIVVIVKMVEDKKIVLVLNKSVFFLIIYLLISISWSEYPVKSLYVFFSLISVFVLTFIAVSPLGIQSVIDDAYYACMPLVWLSLLLIFVVPEIGISIGDNHSGKWQGAFNHKNGLGAFSVFYIWVVWFSESKNKALRWLNLVGSMILLYGSQSYSASLGFIILLIYVVFSRVPGVAGNVYRFRYYILIGVLMYSVFLIYFSISYSGVILMDKNGSFSGRNLIWLWVMSGVYDSFLVGYGIGALKNITTLSPSLFYNSVGFLVGTAHNGFLEILYDGGIVGLTLILLLFHNLLNRVKDIELPIVITFLMLITSINTFESKLLGFNIYFVVLMLISANLKNTKKVVVHI